jgi:23S rRNA G2445 N2-methylase RlmL
VTDRELHDRLRLVGVAGSNKVMAGEMSRLARRAVPDSRLPEPRKEGLGAVAYPFDARLAWAAVNYHRTSARVEWALYRSSARRLEPLYDDLVAAVAADTRPWAEDGATLSVTAFNVKEFAAGERQVVGTVKNALIEGARRRGVGLVMQPESPVLPFIVRLVDGDVVVSLDLLGRPMHQRGYRLETVAAPLREDLASVLLMLARYDARSEVLIDPMAGSGTLAIEAACMADARPLWKEHDPACRRFMPFRSFERPEAPLFADTRAAVLAVDRDDRAVRACRGNVECAGVSESVTVHHGDFRALDPAAVMQRFAERGTVAERGLILSNPPYGERLDAEDLADLYRDLGVWTRRFRGFRAAFIVANPDFERAFGGRPRVKKPLNNGPLRGHFYLYEG